MILLYRFIWMLLCFITLAGAFVLFQYGYYWVGTISGVNALLVMFGLVATADGKGKS